MNTAIHIFSGVSARFNARGRARQGQSKKSKAQLAIQRSVSTALAGALLCIANIVWTPPALAQAQAGGTPVKGGTLRVGVRSNPSTLDPHVMANAWDQNIYYAIFDTLVELDESLRPKPALATSWEAPNPQTLIFNLRKGVKFHDGTDFNAQAVKFNLDRIMDPATKSSRRVFYEAIKSVDVVNESTVRLNLSRPSASLLGALGGISAFMASPAAVQKMGKDFARNPVGTGPFRFVEWTMDDHITLKRNDTYWQPNLPYLDSVVFRVIPEETVNTMNVMSGNLDLTLTIAPKDIATLKASKAVRYAEVPGGYYELRLNNSQPPFNNKLLRQAVSYAVDREAIRRGVHSGVGSVALGPLSPGEWAFDSTLKETPFDLAKSKALLAQAGMPNGFKFELQTRNEPLFVRWAEALKSQLARANIEVDIKVMEFIAGNDNMWAGRYQGTLGQGLVWADPDLALWGYYHSKGGRTNFVRYSNAEVDALLDKARSIYDTAERKKYYAEAARIIVDDAGKVYTVYQPSNAAMNAKVHGFNVYPDSLIRLTRVWMTK